MELIAKGTSREIYHYSSNLVVKKAINAAGFAQNQTEIQLYKTYKESIYAPILTSCKSLDEQCILMEKKISLPTIIHSRIDDYVKLHYPQVSFPNWDMVVEFAKKAGLYFDDVCSPDAWGVSKTHASLIDFGCTNDIFYQYYYE